MKLTKTKDELFDLLEDPTLIKTDEWATKHDCHAECYVVQIYGKHYEFTVEYSYNDGIQDDEVELYEVEPYQVTTTKYLRVKTPFNTTPVAP